MAEVDPMASAAEVDPMAEAAVFLNLLCVEHLHQEDLVLWD